MAPIAREAPLTARVVREEAEWDALRPEWDALYAACAAASPCLDFTWLRQWWRTYGDAYGTGGLRIVMIRRDGSLAAVLPLYAGCDGAVSVLRFISTGEAEYEETCPEYLDLLCRADDRAAGAEAAWGEVTRLEWDRVEWLDVPEDSPLLRLGRAQRRAQVVGRGACPVADLSGGFEAYLGRLSANGRQQARRLLREGDRSDARFELAGPAEAAGAFGDLHRLHEERWRAAGQPGAFTSSRFVEFHRRLIRDWLPDGRAVLARLWQGDDLMAVLYGFVAGGKFDFYQSGLKRDGAGALRSPGTLAHLLLMKTLADRGVTAYDFLRGESSYKDRLATRENRLAALHLRRVSAATAVAVTRRFASRLSRAVGRGPIGAKP